MAQDLKVNERSLRFVVLEHYVETVMLFAGAEPARVLGLAAGASRAEMRTHLRWLMRWLHPDHNPAAWRSPSPAVCSRPGARHRRTTPWPTRLRDARVVSRAPGGGAVGRAVPSIRCGSRGSPTPCGKSGD